MMMSGDRLRRSANLKQTYERVHLLFYSYLVHRLQAGACGHSSFAFEIYIDSEMLLQIDGVTEALQLLLKPGQLDVS